MIQIPIKLYTVSKKLVLNFRESVWFSVILHSDMMCTDNFYWYGVSAAAYLVTCWVFAGVRWFHTCRAPKERHSYIWPDRKMQVFFYLLGTCLLPYVLNPGSESAWMLWKSYFPCTYYFYCGALLFCFFGSVKQWNRWKRVSAIAGAITMVAMVPLEKET